MKILNNIKWMGGIVLLLVLAMFIAMPAQAFESRGGDRVVIGSDEIVEDDLYVTAGTFILEGTIKGDLVVSGSMIYLKPGSVVEGDLLAAGQSISIEGTVEDDARLAGMGLIIDKSAEIMDDVVAVGYGLEIKEGGKVQGDVLFFGAQFLLAGDVDGNVDTGANAFQLDGSVGGDVDAEVGDPAAAPPFNPMMFIPGMPSMAPIPGGFTLGEGAKISGNLTYTSSVEVDIPETAVGGKITRIQPVLPEPVEPTTAPKQPTVVDLGLKWLWTLVRRFVSLLIVGLLFAWLAPGLVKRGAETARQKPVSSLGWGIVMFVGFFFALAVLAVIVGLLAVILGAITLGDLTFMIIFAGFVVAGAAGLVFKVAVSYLSVILVAMMIGSWLLGLISVKLAENRFWPLLLGLFILAVLIAIPILGFLVKWLIIFIGLGALWNLSRDWWLAKEGFGQSTPTPADIAEAG